MESLWMDLKYGARTLAKNPGFALIAVATLALGIGANTAIFSIVHAVLLRPLPYHDADRLAVAHMSIPDYRDLKVAAAGFDRMSVWASNLYNLRAGGKSEQLLGAVVSDQFFPLLGEASLGRTFRPEEDNEPVVVISHDLWARRFGSDPAVLGKTLDLGGRAYTIVGVMPAEFQYPASQFKLWVPFGSALAAAPEQAENRSLRIFRCVARIAPGVTLAEAQAQADAVASRLQHDYPDTNAGIDIRFTSLRQSIVGATRPILMVLLATVGFVLLIACANVANLMLGRTASREKEIALRTALGAGRWRVIRQLLTESALIGVAGGVFGLLLALWGVDTMRGLNPSEVPRIDGAGIDATVLLFTLSLSLLTGLLFGAAPALSASRTDLNSTLKEGGRGASGGASAGGRKHYLANGLVVVEIALSLIVLIGAGLLVRSFERLLSVDAGFRAENLLTMNVQLVKYQDPHRRAAAASEVIARLERIPGVVAAGAGTGLPPVTAQRATKIEIQGRELTDPGQRSAYFIAVSPDYFRALGAPLLAGRLFDAHDSSDAASVVLISRDLARRVFGDEDPVGRSLRLVNPEQTNEWRTIVGVVGDIRYSGLDDADVPTVYTPFEQTPFLWAYIMLRTSGDPALLVQAARSAVASTDPDLDAADVLPMQQIVSRTVAQPRFNMLLLGMFALLALALAAVGIYGVIAFSVTRRTHEIGVRMALGARQADVLRLVVGQGLKLFAMGLAAGLCGALALTRMMTSMLFGIGAADASTYVCFSILLGGVAVLASWIPARRAARVDPMIALRCE